MDIFNFELWVQLLFEYFQDSILTFITFAYISYLKPSHCVLNASAKNANTANKIHILIWGHVNEYQVLDRSLPIRDKNWPEIFICLLNEREHEQSDLYFNIIAVPTNAPLTCHNSPKSTVFQKQCFVQIPVNSIAQWVKFQQKDDEKTEKNFNMLMLLSIFFYTIMRCMIGFVRGLWLLPYNPDHNHLACIVTLPLRRMENRWYTLWDHRCSSIMLFCQGKSSETCTENEEKWGNSAKFITF